MVDVFQWKRVRFYTGYLVYDWGELADEWELAGDQIAEKMGRLNKN